MPIHCLPRGHILNKPYQIGSEKMAPHVSVILSTYNAYERLKNCLYSLTLQDYPLASMEVIIIDDASTDITETYIKNTSYPFPVIYEKNDQNRGRSYTRNKGIQFSSGKILIFCDCDMILPPDFVTNHLNYHFHREDLVVCGSFWNQIPLPNQPTFEEIRNQNYKYVSHEQAWAYWFKQFPDHYGRDLTSFHFPWMYFVVMNVSVRKEHVENAGYFDESFKGYGGEDEELGYRLYKNGLSFLVDTNLKNYHQEHQRSLTESSESLSNIQHILDKHPKIDTLLFYQYKTFDHFYKNDVLNELVQMKQAHPALTLELEERFIKAARNGLRHELIDLYDFSRQLPCPLFSNMIKKKIKQRRNV